MIKSARVIVGALLVAALPSTSAAQAVARSFAEIQAILEPGDYVIVIDRAEQETWGQVAAVSERTLTVATARRFTDRVEISGDRRSFAEDDVSLVLRSDATGVRGVGVYPASWDRVRSLQPGSELTVVLTSGERQANRLAEATASGLRVLTSSGRSVAIEKSDILRIERRSVDDPVGNGIAIGALAGAGAGAAVASYMYATCGGTCDAPARGPTFLLSMGVCAGIGAAAGWIVDRAHKGKEVVFPVVPVVTRDRKGLTFVLRF
jgi:hypothetical protein